MTYEIQTYTCPAGDYFVVYLHHGNQRLAQLMTLSIKEAEEFIRRQYNDACITHTVYIP